jgi:hypothetical protein
MMLGDLLRLRVERDGAPQIAVILFERPNSTVLPASVWPPPPVSRPAHDEPESCLDLHCMA